MDVAAAEENFSRPHSHHLTFWEELLQRRQRCRIVGIVERGDHDASISNVEVDVGASQTIARLARYCPFHGIYALALFLSDADWIGLVDLVDLQRAALRICGRPTSMVGVPGYLALRVR